VIEAEKAKVTAENKQVETARMAAIDAVLSDLPFPNPDGKGKAKQQFRDAYQGKVKRDEDGSFIVETDKGPMGVDVFLKTEFEESPHFAASQGHGGAGATGGTKPAGGSKLLDIQGMTTEQILKAPKEQLDATLAAAVNQWQRPS